jgi:hypothetical protein
MHALPTTILPNATMSPTLRAPRAALIVAATLLAACSDASTSSLAGGTTVSTTVPTTCSAARTLAVGQVVSGLTGSSVCVGGISAAAEYALVAFNGSTSSSSASFSVSGTDLTGPSASSTLLTTSAATGLSASLATLTSPLRANRGFELALRAKERLALTSLIPGARRWNRARTTTRAAYDVIPSSVTAGQLLRLNANADDACRSPSYRYGRVVAVTSKAIVVADTGNPAGGYTDAEYAAVGAQFDNVVDPLDRGAFGDPSDIDGNGRVVLFFTKTVNDLTPATSDSYVGGFFFARDLFPVTSTIDFDACSGSNMGEMFYVMVPDPTRGGSFSKTNVSTEVLATIAHEYQHLINSSRRMYVNTGATDFEESWLDEGLAHVAEELLFYKTAGVSPRSNLDVTALRSSTAILSAFNNYESSNFARYDDYLLKPSDYSPIADNDSLATRGASWSFLRYAADQKASADGAIWHDLANSTTTGVANLQNVFGTGIINLLRDWGTSVIADDVSGSAAPYQQPSWNFRSIFAVLENSSVFPLATVSLASGAKTVSLVRGANVYLRFAVAAGGSGTVTWTSAPSSVQFSLVRLK